MDGYVGAYLEKFGAPLRTMLEVVMTFDRLSSDTFGELVYFF